VLLPANSAGRGILLVASYIFYAAWNPRSWSSCGSQLSWIGSRPSGCSSPIAKTLILVSLIIWASSGISSTAHSFWKLPRTDALAGWTSPGQTELSCRSAFRSTRSRPVPGCISEISCRRNRSSTTYVRHVFPSLWRGHQAMVLPCAISRSGSPGKAAGETL
jgi:hypothetical protein